MSDIHPIQQKAIHFVEEYARPRCKTARETLQIICERSNIKSDMIDSMIENIQQHANIAIHFHPDVVNLEGKSVLENLLEGGVYRNQFETHLSNGLLDPTVGGRRVQWEDMLFGEVYDGSATNMFLRPKYGSLSLMGDPYGPSPRFGSCYLLLKPICMTYSTFCYGDSSQNPSERGTWKHLEDVLAALFMDCFTNEHVLGLSNIRPPQLFEHLCQNFQYRSAALQNAVIVRNLNHYIETQIHSEIVLEKHVVSIVADPSFRQSIYEEMLQSIQTTYNIPIQWHQGFTLHIDDVVDDFRGPLMSKIAKKIAHNGRIDAKIIGQARINAVQYPENWTEFQESPSQLLKYLWHVLLRFGTSFHGAI